MADRGAEAHQLRVELEDVDPAAASAVAAATLNPETPDAVGNVGVDKVPVDAHLG